MRRTVVVLAVAVASCAPRVAITSGSTGVSLIPKYTAVALQPMTSPDVVAGKLVHIDAGEIIILTSRGPVGVTHSVVKAFQRDEVLHPKRGRLICQDLND